MPQNESVGDLTEIYQRAQHRYNYSAYLSDHTVTCRARLEAVFNTLSLVITEHDGAVMSGKYEQAAGWRTVWSDMLALCRAELDAAWKEKANATERNLG